MDQTTSSVGGWNRVGNGSRPRDPAQTGPVETQPTKPANAYNSMQREALGLMKDIIRLTDLQFQLLALDVKDFWNKSRVGLVATFIAGIMLLAGIVVFLFGLSDLLQVSGELSPHFAKLIVSSVAIVIAGLLIGAGGYSLSRATRSLKRSQAELKENMNWIREMLSHDDAKS